MSDIVVPEFFIAAILRLPELPASRECTLDFANIQELFQREPAQF
ncbi:hypothetical protein [Ruegeria sp. HKCCD6157]|nr:hypothetical protein [Ruegeria sp. HKCCD6157]